MKESKTTPAKTTVTVEVDAETAVRVHRAAHPRKRTLSLLFHGPDVDAWQAIAAANKESLTDLIERTMNALVKTR